MPVSSYTSSYTLSMWGAGPTWGKRGGREGREGERMTFLCCPGPHAGHAVHQWRPLPWADCTGASRRPAGQPPTAACPPACENDPPAGERSQLPDRAKADRHGRSQSCHGDVSFLITLADLRVVCHGDISFLIAMADRNGNSRAARPCSIWPTAACL